jgi:hypothetical protein
MARSDFTQQLVALGYEVQDHGDGKISIPYVVPTGKFAEKSIRLGFVPPDDFPLNPPSGPHVSPELLPRQSGGTHPSGGINESPFGAEWQYWSRPVHHWAETNRAVKDVLAHIRHLFDTQ